MIPQLGFGEMLVLAILALVVIGPKDLPLMMRKAGRFFGRIRAMGQEFRDAMDEMGHQAELDELKKEVKRLKDMGGLDDDMYTEMREIERDIRDNTKLDEPAKPKTAKPASEETPDTPAPDDKGAPS